MAFYNSLEKGSCGALVEIEQLKRKAPNRNYLRLSFESILQLHFIPITNLKKSKCCTPFSPSPEPSWWTATKSEPFSFS